MEIFVIILIIIVIYVGLYFVIQFFNRNKENKSVINNELSKRNNNNQKVLAEETIIVNNAGQDEEFILKIIEDDGDIKKVDENFITAKGNELYSIEGTIDTFWGDSDGGPIPGNSILINSEHVIITKSMHDINNSSNYYININDITKITRKNGYYEFSDGEEEINVPIATFTIYTKNNNFLELVYPNEVLIPDKNCPMLIKNTNNSICFEYTYDMNNQGENIKYEFADKQLKIGKNRFFDPAKPNSKEYEIVVNYSDILTKDIVNNGDVLNVIIETKNNYKYILVFADDNEATKFYNELNVHHNGEV